MASGSVITGHTTETLLSGALLIAGSGNRLARYGTRRTHLFMAVPAGLAMLMGQLVNTFAPVHLYEHVQEGADHYASACILRC